MGERLIGDIVVPTKALFDRMNFSISDFESGIWLKRKNHLSFIAHSSIKFKRPATIFDVEN